MKVPIAAHPLILAVLYGCNASDPGTVTPVVANAETLPASSAGPNSAGSVHFEGNWQGTLTSELSQTTSRAIALVNGWGEFRLIADGAQFVGWPYRTATNIGGTVTGIRAAGSTWNDGTRSGIFELDGRISEDDFIEASYEGGGERGMFALAWAVNAESRIDSIIGTWVQYDDNHNIVASIRIEGRDTWRANIHGSHTNGCTYSGQTDAWTSRYSYDIVPFEANGCPLVAGIDVSGTYSGTGALIDLVDDASEEPALVIALSNDLQHQVTFFLYRVSD